MSKGVSQLLSKWPRPTQQVLSRDGVHTQAGCRACTFKDSTVSGMHPPTVQRELSWAHSGPQLSKSATALRLIPHGQSTNSCQITEDVGFSGQKITKHLPQHQGQPGSKGTELASWLLQWGGLPCQPTAAAPRCSSSGNGAVQAATCTHTLVKSD